ncbi:MAG: 1-deoxy-D-xylulose-5-phosphate synthase [Ruminococcaceae bacterium]|nr:1-deoxy-D-xylulose-5-phosphate synthase [Oscillospiraceae bacterium]
MLQRINSHKDLVRLSDAQRTKLCDEIRSFLIDRVSRTGGHLASNLGVVELTVALETVYDTRSDRLVFDVGHQSYVHKLLTGRQADFDSLRQFGGIAGFPKPSESDTDAFVAGHASSSVSIALGMARARTLLKQDYDVVALIGDGAATGGMAYEGMNDAAASGEPLLIILNDNEMSIDRNVGGMSRHLSSLRTKEKYLGMKQQYREAMSKLPGGKAIYRTTSQIKGWVKRSVLPTTMFENMGLSYLGPVDGHDVNELIRVMRVAKEMRCPVLLHVFTQKGCGYLPAEEMPSRYHGVGKFDPETGKTLSGKSYTFSDAFGDTMVQLAKEDNRVCAITAAMPGGTGLLPFKEQFPKRLFDVGIAEEHAASMAGGLAKQGMKPVLALYSTFLQRSFDQIIQDIAMLKLHVVVAVDRAGLVGEDGETHHGVFDVGFLRQVPGMSILAPASCKELQDMLFWAVKEYDGPVAVRYPRGGDGMFGESLWDPDKTVVAHRDGKAAAIVTYGNLVNNALSAAERLAAEGVDISVVRLTQLGFIDFEELEDHLRGIENVIIAEDASVGISEAVTAALGNRHHIFRLNLGRGYVSHGSVTELHKQYGLDSASLAATVKEVLRNEN